MNILLLLIISVLCLSLAYLFYSRYIARVLKSCDQVPTPAHTLRDGRDYVPTPMTVLFSHHYATIAGAGPIVGPTIAAIYGVWPAWLWVVAGAIFVGAVHDYTSLFISLREKGRTIAEITGNLTGRWGFVLYISFTLLLIVIVTAAFLDLSTVALTSKATTSFLHLTGNPFGWESWQESGTSMVRIGGIATMSVIIITILAPLMGLLIHRLKLNTWLMALIALGVAVGSIWFGIYHPVNFAWLEPTGVKAFTAQWLISLPMILLAAVLVIALLALVRWIVAQRFSFTAWALTLGYVLLAIVLFTGFLAFLVSNVDTTDGLIRAVWMLALAVYVLFASALPVWMILQPRDFVNSFVLYGGIALLAVVSVVGGLRGLSTDAALGWNVAEGTRYLGLIWPVLFITIACGAISGFHSLVASGTSSKQCNRESDARRIGYGGMLSEGLLAVLVIIAIGAGLGHGQLLAVQFPETGAGNPILSFALGTGILTNQALGIPIYLGTIFGLLMVEGFLVTTLDTAVRLNRYLFEELWRFIWPRGVPALFKHYYFNAGLSVVIMLLIAYPNGWKIIWPVFGTANQLLAALTLATVSIWLAFRLRPTWFTLVPAIFMMVTCLGSLALILKGQWGALTSAAASPNWAVLILALLLFALGLGVIYIAGTRLWAVYSGKREPIRDDPADTYLVTSS